MKKAVRFFIFSAIWVSLSCCNDQTADFATAQKTLEVLIAAAQEGNVDRFVDCLDLEYYVKRAQVQNPDAEITDKKMRSLLKTAPLVTATRELMSVFNQYQWSVLYEKEIGINARELTLRIFSKDAADLPEDDEMKLIFINRDKKWKLELQSSFGAKFRY